MSDRAQRDGKKSTPGGSGKKFQGNVVKKVAYKDTAEGYLFRVSCRWFVTVYVGGVLCVV